MLIHNTKPFFTGIAIGTTEQESPGTSKQRTLEETLDLKKVWDINSANAKSIHNSIGEMIAVDNQPFSIVEDLGFNRLLQKIKPNYVIPSRKYFTDTVVPFIHTSVMAKVKNIVEEAEHISFTTDIWTSVSNDAFISLTGHCLSKDFGQKTVVLRVMPFPGSHTAAHISDMINEVIREFDIPSSKIHLIVRDNGANVVKGVEDAGYDSLSCFLHTLQLVIHDCILEQRIIKDIIADCRKLVGHFSHSPLSCTKLEKLQEENNLPKHKLIQNVPTRWNSTFFMLERIHEQKQALVVYCASCTQLPSFDGNKWNLIGKLACLLKVFHKITVRLSERNCLVSEIIPQVKFLKHFINKASKDPRFTGLGSTMSALKESLETRFDRYTTDYNVIISTFLDPRFKADLFETSTSDSCKFKLENIETELAKTQEKLKQLRASETAADAMLAHSSSNESEEGGNDEEKLENPNETEYDFDACYEEMVAQSRAPDSASKSRKSSQKSKLVGTSSLKNDIAKYMAMDKVQREANPLQWWGDNMIVLTSLAPLAKKYLSSPPSSIESERLFSIGGNIYSPHRNRLTASNGEMLMFLNYNLRMFNFSY